MVCTAFSTNSVMAALEAAIQPASVREPKRLDGRVKPGHDVESLGTGATAPELEH